MVIPVSRVGKGLIQTSKGGGGSGGGGGRAGGKALEPSGRNKKGSVADARAEELRAMMAELASHFQEV
jgi:hypothetical protein